MELIGHGQVLNNIGKIKTLDHGYLTMLFYLMIRTDKDFKQPGR